MLFKLSQHLQTLRKFIEESEHGVIYVSFGTMLKARTTPRDKLEAIIEALSKFPQRVVWKWEKDTLPGNPKNIYLSKWLPQNDILGTQHLTGSSITYDSLSVNKLSQRVLKIIMSHNTIPYKNNHTKISPPNF